LKRSGLDEKRDRTFPILRWHPGQKQGVAQGFVKKTRIRSKGPNVEPSQKREKLGRSSAKLVPKERKV